MIEEKEMDVDISVSVMEIYNKKIRDLLSKVHTHTHFSTPLTACACVLVGKFISLRNGTRIRLYVMRWCPVRMATWK